MDWLNFLVYAFLVVMWLRTWQRHLESSKGIHRQRMAQWMWALVGGVIGSFSGVAAFGTAVAGTIPGAAFGFVVAGYLILRRQQPVDPQEEQRRRDALLQGAELAGAVTGAAVLTARSAGIALVLIAASVAKLATQIRSGGAPTAPSGTQQAVQRTAPQPPDADSVDPSHTYAATVSRIEGKYPQLAPESCPDVRDPCVR